MSKEKCANIILYCSHGSGPSLTKRGCFGCWVVELINELAGFYERMRNRRMLKKTAVRKMSAARRRRMKLRATSEPTGYADKEIIVKTRRSVCCNALVHIEGRTTLFYVCEDCGDACDAVDVH